MIVYTDGMYTVKQLSQLAGITARTLHYYDEIGLLTPSRVGDNEVDLRATTLGGRPAGPVHFAVMRVTHGKKRNSKSEYRNLK